MQRNNGADVRSGTRPDCWMVLGDKTVQAALVPRTTAASSGQGDEQSKDPVHASER